MHLRTYVPGLLYFLTFTNWRDRSGPSTGTDILLGRPRTQTSPEPAGLRQGESISAHVI